MFRRETGSKCFCFCCALAPIGSDVGSITSAASATVRCVGGSRFRDDGGGERVLVPRPIMAAAVDEEGWRPVDSAAHATHEILTHPGPVLSLHEFKTESLDFQPERVGIADKVVFLQGVLALKEQVMHLPEATLGRRALGGLGGALGVRVNLRQREVPKHQPKLVAQLGKKVIKHRMCGPAVRAFKVAVLDEGDRRGRSPRMWSRSSETGVCKADDDDGLSMGCLRVVFGVRAGRVTRLKFLEGVEDAVGAGVDAKRRDVRPTDHAVAVDDE